MEISDKDLEELKIDKFIQKCMKLNSVDALLTCENFVSLVAQMERPDNPGVKEFMGFIMQLQLIIFTNRAVQKPVGMKEGIFIKAKPVIEKLVTCNRLRKYPIGCTFFA